MIIEPSQFIALFSFSISYVQYATGKKMGRNEPGNEAKSVVKCHMATLCLSERLTDW